MSKLTFDKGITIIGYLSVLAIAAILGYGGYMEFIYDPMSPVFRMIDKLDKEEVYQTEKILLTNNEEVIFEFLNRVDWVQFKHDASSRHTIKFRGDEMKIIHLNGEEAYLLLNTQGRLSLGIPKQARRVKNGDGHTLYIRTPENKTLDVKGIKDINTFRELLEVANITSKQDDSTQIKVNNYINLAYKNSKKSSD